MKKLLALILASILLLSLPLAAFAEEESPAEGEIIEEYVNIKKAGVSLTIASNGNTSIIIYCQGIIGTTHISSTTYLEKQNSYGTWDRVSINGASQISDGVSGSYLSRTYTTTVGTGTYRATSVFTVTRGGVDETITVYSNIVYH